MTQTSIFDIGVEYHYQPPLYFDRPVRLFEAFAGVGCQAMGFKRAEIPYESVGISEIDKHSIRSYNAIHGDTKNLEDIRMIAEIPPCDIFTWSFPCQDLSKAGKRKGMNETTRSGLVYEVLRLLKVSKPKCLIMENVPDLVEEAFKAQFYEIQKEIESHGYRNFTLTLNAKGFGVAQNRNRVFMVSLLGGGWYEFPMPTKLTKRLKDYLEEEVDQKYYLSEKAIKGLQRADKRNHTPSWLSYDSSEIGCIDTRVGALTHWSPYLEEPICLNSKVYGKQPSLQDRINDTKGVSTAITQAFMPSIAIPEKTAKGYALAQEGDGVYLNRPEQKRGVVQKGKIQIIKASGNDVGVVIGSMQKNAYHGTTDDPCPTLNAAMGMGGGQMPMIDNGLRIRKLTPLECWRLMGIDDFDFYKAQAVNSNSQLYKQAGNGIVVDVFAAILKQLVVVR